MKKINIIVLSILLSFSTNTIAQIVKADEYIPGTKLTYYINSCNTDLPEADGKISFCDEAGNLGVVEKSFGLNSQTVYNVIPNYFNNDEVFLTDDGISVLKVDGTWFNIPRKAIPGGIWLDDAIVTETGKLLFGYTNEFIDDLAYLDLNTLTFESFDIDNNNAKSFIYDNATNTTYVFSKANNNIKLYSINADNIDDVGIISSLSTFYENVKISTLSNGFIYTPTSSGLQLYKIDINDPSNVTIYDQNDFPSTENIKDLDVDNNGDLWISFSNFSTGGLAKFDVNTELFEFYTTENTSNGNLPMFNLAVASNGDIWMHANTSGFYGIVKFEPGETNPWTFFTYTDFENLGFPIDYDYIGVNNEGSIETVENIDNSIYITFGDSNYQVIRNENNDWSGITHYTPGNFTNRNFYYTSNYEDKYLLNAKNSGIWSFNSMDNNLTKIEDNDVKLIEDFQYIDYMKNYFTIDTDGKPTSVTVFDNNLHISKVNEPILEIGLEINYDPKLITPFRDELWLLEDSSNASILHKYFNGNEISNYTLTNYDNSGITPDSNGNIMYSSVDMTNNVFNIYQFDVNSNTLNTFSHNYDFSTLNPGYGISNLIQLSFANGKMAFLLNNVIFLFDNGVISDIPIENLGFPDNINIDYAVADELGNIVLTNNYEQLVRIFDPFNFLSLETYDLDEPLFDGDNTLLLDIPIKTKSMVIDNDGNIWFSSRNNFSKIYLSNPIPANSTSGLPRIKGTVYYDENDNDTYDSGEELANQRLAIRKGNNQSIRYSFTNKDGEFQFLYQGTGDYTLTILGSDPYKFPDSTYFLDFNVSDDSQDTDLGLINLKTIKIESLLVKSSEKVGAFGFDRAGFENTFTTAIGNISGTKTFTNLDLQFLYKNKDELSNNVLPQIDEVNIYEVTTTENTPIIYNTTIIPSSHRWNIQRNPSTYTIDTLNLNPIITTNDDIITVDVDIAQLNPYNMIVIEVKTDLFNPQNNGAVIEYGLSSIAGDNIGEFGDPGDFMLIPRPDNGGQPFFPDIPPPIDPLNPGPPPDFPTGPVFAPDGNDTTILSSYDPNDKLVSPGLPDVLNEIDIDTPFLTYTIRFENEGNFSAKDIYILDELDPNLDLNSIQLIESSHEVLVDQLEIDGKTNLRFFFENIFLDFTDNDPVASQGYVKFVVRPIDNIQENTVVENTAAIYFDQNPPIITNTTQHKFMVITMSNEDFSDEAVKVKAFPNPVSDYLQINLPNQGDYEIQIYDITGKQLMEKQYKNQSNILIPFNNFSKGQYIIKVISANNNASIKIIKN